MGRHHKSKRTEPETSLNFLNELELDVGVVIACAGGKISVFRSRKNSKP